MPDNKAEQRREEAEARADEYHSTSETARPFMLHTEHTEHEGVTCEKPNRPL